MTLQLLTVWKVLALAPKAVLALVPPEVLALAPKVVLALAPKEEQVLVLTMEQVRAPKPVLVLAPTAVLALAPRAGRGLAPAVVQGQVRQQGQGQVLTGQVLGQVQASALVTGPFQTALGQLVQKATPRKEMGRLPKSPWRKERLWMVLEGLQRSVLREL